MPRFRPLHLTKAALRILVYTVAALLIVVVVAIAAIETGWVKNQIRRIIVNQANGYLTATLEIGQLQGSLFRGLTLSNVKVSQNGRTIIAIDDVSVSYSIRELFEPGVIIRRVRLTRPRVIVARLPDGRWNMSALVKREQRERQSSGPRRPLRVLAIEIADGDVELRDPLTFEAVHVPQRYAALNVSGAYDYQPVTSYIQLGDVSWNGGEDGLSMRHLAGGLVIGPAGWEFHSLHVTSARSEFTLSGRINRSTQPTMIDLHAAADRFAFQEWSPVLGGMHNIAVEGRFNLALTGPPANLTTNLTLAGTGGDVDLAATLNTTVPGWHGKGEATVSRVNLARWLNREDRPSDITGHVVFDLDFDLGRHFPRGGFNFVGPRAKYIGYEISDLKARGTLTATEALIADATGAAYGSQLHITQGSIGIDEPFSYHFVGSDAGMDLTKLPPEVPITHVASDLALDSFDVTGQFASPLFIKGEARFGASTYLGARVGAGTVGAVDTSTTPTQYSGDGEISDLDINRFGRDLDVVWMRDPRWAGIVAGHFHVKGAGSGPLMTLEGGGRLARADMFHGHLTDADVSIQIANGSLSGTYNGAIESMDAETAFADPRFRATLAGSADATFAVHDIMKRTTSIDDYDVSGTLALRKSTIRGVAIDTGSVEGRLAGTSLTITRLDTKGAIDATASGRIEFDGETSSDFHYEIGSADLSLLNDAVGYTLLGTLTASGSLTGPMTAAHVVGDANFDNLDVNGTSVLSTTGKYDATVSWDEPRAAAATFNGSATEIYTAGRDIPSIEGTVTYDAQRVTARLVIDPLWVGAPRETGSLAVDVDGRLRYDESAFDVSRLQFAVGTAQTWRLASPSATISWNDAAIGITPAEFVDVATGAQHVSIGGSWRTDGTGTLKIGATGVSLDALTSEGAAPARYGGLLDLDATIRGTRDHPVAAADITVRDGRVRKLTYQQLGGHVAYDAGVFNLDLRLDQSAGVWLTAKGRVPMNLSGTTPPDAALDLRVASSTVGLGLLEGITDVVHDVAGQLVVNLDVVGTVRDPHFTGNVTIANAAFVVSASGARYKNGSTTLELTSDRVNVSAFHLEDRNGRTLDLFGSLGTRALSVGDIHIDAIARRFEVLHNDTGSVDIDTTLQLRGNVDHPQISGDVTILSGELKVDRIFERALFQPYATSETVIPASAGVSPPLANGTPVDAIAALNPWDRLGLDISIHSRGTLRLTGDNVQVATGTPLGLGSFNLRATGDLYLSKNAGQPAYVTGSFDSISGSYAFQGRRFDVDPTSSINFRGDLNPEIYITVNRVISGVETRVTIAGELQQPELRLASTPPLESSDILSLIVFNTSTSELSATQQQALAVRAGTLAYGFVATPLIAALSRSIGLDTLEIAPPNTVNGVSYGPSVTVGNELVPGLVAQFTRAFGQEAYDEATVEYYISRILRIRATFSDAQSLVLRDQPFRRIERAGIDLLFFFSF